MDLYRGVPPPPGTPLVTAYEGGMKNPFWKADLWAAGYLDLTTVSVRLSVRRWATRNNVIYLDFHSTKRAL